VKSDEPWGQWEITYRKNAKASNEITAKGLQIHWALQEKMDGNARLEWACPNARKKKKYLKICLDRFQFIPLYNLKSFFSSKLYNLLC
jgi:hypothetical protein